MPLSKKELKDIKEKLHNSNPKAISNIKKNRTKVVVTNETEAANVRKKRNKPKSIVRWNFNVNDLVKIKTFPNDYLFGSEDNVPIGLIVSDYIYHSSKVEKNNFFVLVENAVMQFDGKYLRKL